MSSQFFVVSVNCRAVCEQLYKALPLICHCNSSPTVCIRDIVLSDAYLAVITIAQNQLTDKSVKIFQNTLHFSRKTSSITETFFHVCLFKRLFRINDSKPRNNISIHYTHQLQNVRNII